MRPRGWAGGGEDQTIMKWSACAPAHLPHLIVTTARRDMMPNVIRAHGMHLLEISTPEVTIHAARNSLDPQQLSKL